MGERNQSTIGRRGCPILDALCQGWDSAVFKTLPFRAVVSDFGFRQPLVEARRIALGEPDQCTPLASRSMLSSPRSESAVGDHYAHLKEVSPIFSLAPFVKYRPWRYVSTAASPVPAAGTSETQMSQYCSRKLCHEPDRACRAGHRLDSWSVPRGPKFPIAQAQ